MSILSLRNVSRRFGGGEALIGIDLEIDRPQVIGLVGRNGAGKSTLLRLLPPFIHASSGSVEVLGMDPWADPIALRGRMGYVADQDVVPTGVRGRDLLALCAAVYPRWDTTLIQTFQRRLGIDPNQLFSSLSRGQQRQLALLMAIGHRPELLLLDEPAGNLDPAVRKEVLGIIIELLNESGTTVILATHLLSDLERLAERLVILSHGRKVHDGSIEDMTRDLCRIELAPGIIDLGGLAHSQLLLAQERHGLATVLILACAPGDAGAVVAGLAGPGAVVLDAKGMTFEEAFIYRTRDLPAVTTAAARL